MPLLQMCVFLFFKTKFFNSQTKRDSILVCQKISICQIFHWNSEIMKAAEYYTAVLKCALVDSAVKQS